MLPRMAIAERITGRDLRMLRLSRDVRQRAVAEAWPCSRQNVQRVEGSRRPTSAAITAYLAALERADS
jgi:hypothetical protein